MSYYRDVYLKSQDWKNLRAAILIAQENICECCGGVATEVHHLNYRKLDNVNHFDLMATCRPCHDLIHKFLKENPEIHARQREKHGRPEKGGLGIRKLIADKISPRGYISFKPYFGTGKNWQSKRIRIGKKANKLRAKVKYDQSIMVSDWSPQSGSVVGRGIEFAKRLTT